MQDLFLPSTTVFFTVCFRTPILLPAPTAGHAAAVAGDSSRSDDDDHAFLIGLMWLVQAPLMVCSRHFVRRCKEGGRAPVVDQDVATMPAVTVMTSVFVTLSSVIWRVFPFNR